MKLDAKWKSENTARLIELLHDMVRLHLRDVRRALYGNGNYRLVKNQKRKFGISKETCQQLSDSVRARAAKKPGQKKRVRTAKTSC